MNQAVDPIGQAFARYKSLYPLRPPDLSRQQYDDELRQIDLDEGLRSLPVAPADRIVTGAPPRVERIRDLTKYLWVVRADCVSIALEHESAASVTRGRLAHTNLTGGDEAHSAGELWFDDPSTITFNGASSRYRPRSRQELADVAIGFKACGYRVCSMGWDDGTNTPFRVLKGAIVWI